MDSTPPNILLVVLDTVRRKNLSAYGYDRETTPFLDEFSDNAITYQRAYSPAPWTRPSHASLFTGTYAVTHQTNREIERLTPDLPTLAELLAAGGYETVGFSNNAYISPRFDFDRGFDEFTFNIESYNEPLDGGLSISELRSHTGDGPFHREAISALRYIQNNGGSIPQTALNWLYRKASEADLISPRDRGAVSTNEFVSDYLEGSADDPFFLFLNYMEGHAPYQAPDEYQYKYVEDPVVTGWGNAQAQYFNQEIHNQEQKVAALEDQYDGCIRYLDAQIKELVQMLRRNSVLEDTFLVITSDHGELFGEWGLYEHKVGVYDEVTNVPLWIRPPGGESDVVDAPVSIRWLFPTLLQTAGVSVPEHAVSGNLLDPTDTAPIIESEGLPYETVEFGTTVPEKFRSSHQAYVDPQEERKAVQYDHDGSVELYPLGDESRDIADESPDSASTLAERLTTSLTEARQEPRTDADVPVEVEEEIRDHLADLGYK